MICAGDTVVVIRDALRRGPMSKVGMVDTVVCIWHDDVYTRTTEGTSWHVKGFRLAKIIEVIV